MKCETPKPELELAVPTTDQCDTRFVDRSFRRSGALWGLGQATQANMLKPAQTTVEQIIYYIEVIYTQTRLAAENGNKTQHPNRNPQLH